MIVFDISCDVCRKSESFSLGTNKKEMYKTFHRIKRKDICPDCVTAALLGQSYTPHGVNIITRILIKNEKKKIIEFYNLNTL